MLYSRLLTQISKHTILMHSPWPPLIQMLGWLLWECRMLTHTVRNGKGTHLMPRVLSSLWPRLGKGCNLPQHLRTKQCCLFYTFLWILISLFNTIFFVVVPWNSFLLMCKMWLKTSLFGSLTLLWFPENATGSFSLMSSLLPTSLFGPSLEQRSLVTVLPGTQGHQLCSPVATC